MSKNLARMYTQVLEEPLPPALQQVVARLELGRSALEQAKLTAI
jgi:hypothetical protein